MKKCVICGKEFKPRNLLHKTCSKECSNALLAETRRRNSKKYYEKHKDEEKYKVDDVSSNYPDSGDLF